MSDSPAAILYDASGNPVSIDASGRVMVNGSEVVQPVSASALPLPSGAATDAGLASIVSALAAKATEATLASLLTQAGFQARINTLGQKLMDASTPVVLASNQSVLPVTFSIPASIAITVSTDDNIVVPGAQADYFFAAAKYSVPLGYRFEPSTYSGFSGDNRVTARICKLRNMGTWNSATQVYVPGTTYASPSFGSTFELEVVGAPTGNTNDIVVTATYVNQDGVSGRTAVALYGLKMKKQTPVGFKLQMQLQSGDIGVRSVTSISRDTTNAGTFAINGVSVLWQQAMTIPSETYNTPGISGGAFVNAGEVLGLDWASNGGATVRRIVSCPGTLVPV